MGWGWEWRRALARVAAAAGAGKPAGSRTAEAISELKVRLLILDIAALDYE
jgi:hypothetical protein